MGIPTQSALRKLIKKGRAKPILKWLQKKDKDGNPVEALHIVGWQRKGRKAFEVYLKKPVPAGDKFQVPDRTGGVENEQGA